MWYTNQNSIGAKDVVPRKEVRRMKTLFKLLAVLLLLAGVCVAVASLLRREDGAEYISLYRDSDLDEG